MTRRTYDQGRLTKDLLGLPNLDRHALTRQWQELYDSEPPRGISQQLLLRAIAYKMQELALGGLKPAILRFLAKAVEDVSAGKQVSAPAPVIKSGTRLLREWHGVTYEVTVIEDGVQFQGKPYKSLSEVAQLITGVKWSGPLFFGLKKKVAA